MHKLTLASSAILGGLVGLGGVAQANAFLVNEFDARQVGRGNAGAATDTDASAIYYNVGGLAGGTGTQIMVSGSLIFPTGSFTDDLTNVETHVDNDPQGLPGAFISSRLSPLVSVGLGFYVPFGLTLSWPDDAPGNDVAQDEALRTYFITPSIGLDLSRYAPGLLIGGGFDLVPASVDLRRQVYFGEDRGVARLGGTALGVGGRVGVMYRPPAMKRLSLGAMWRSSVKENFSGNGDFDAPPPYRALLPPDGTVRTTITLPQQVSGGAAFRPIDQLEIEGNFVWTEWSRFKTLTIDVPASMENGVMTIVRPENYTDTVSARVGVEYQLPSLHAAVRAGYIYDPTPIPRESLTQELPDINRHDVTAGASYAYGRYDLHLGVLWVIPGSRHTADTPNMPVHKGKFEVQAWVASLTLSARLGAL